MVQVLKMKFLLRLCRFVFVFASSCFVTAAYNNIMAWRRGGLVPRQRKTVYLLFDM